MTKIFSPAMAEALRLTQAGNLGDAMALIRANLAGGAVTRPPTMPVDLRHETTKPLPSSLRIASRPPTGTSNAPAPPAAGSFDRREFVGASGRFSYRLYIPAGDTADMPLVVMLHGCTQSPEDFARGTGMNRLADEMGFLVAYPGQSQSANAQKCWNWFRPGDQRRDSGEPALIAGLTREIVTSHNADADRVYVAGLSAGGAAAAIMAKAYPDIFAAVGIHSGLACGAARDLPSALAAMRKGGSSRREKAPFVPVITFHGDADKTVHQANSSQIVAASAAAHGSELQRRSETHVEGGRKVSRDRHVDRAGNILIEQWTIHGAGHAWSGGDGSGSYADPNGPDASREMVRFFLGHRRKAAG